MPKTEQEHSKFIISEFYGDGYSDFIDSHKSSKVYYEPRKVVFKRKNNIYSKHLYILMGALIIVIPVLLLVYYLSIFFSFWQCLSATWPYQRLSVVAFLLDFRGLQYAK